MPVDDLASTFDAHATATPDALAIVGDGRQLTWSQFAERARRLAWYYEVEANVGAGDRVMIALTGGEELFEALFAALKVGATPVLVDPRGKKDGLRALVDRTDARIVVHAPDRQRVMRDSVKRIPKRWRPVLLGTGLAYERELAAVPPSSDHRPSGASADGQLVVSTGGVEDPARALVWRVGDLWRAVGGQDSTSMPKAVVSLTPLTHALGLLDSLAVLVSGGTVVLVDLEPFDPSAVWDVVERERVDRVFLSGTGVVVRLVEALRRAPARWDLRRLSSLVSPVPLDDVDRRALAELLPAVSLREPSTEPRHVGERTRVIDITTGRDVAPGSGEVGTVLVGGAVPLGYFEEPELTASRFCRIGGVRYAITGEQATVDEHGLIATVTTVPDVIVVGGQPMLAEVVEARLRKHPSVAECVVIGVSDGLGGRRFVALVQVVDGHYLDEAELTAWSRARLPASATPARFLLVDHVEPPNDAPGAREIARSRVVEMLRFGDS
jgi:acyl-CoA synthetase (AMP-forming)/AMP-acid ligase II